MLELNLLDNALDFLLDAVKQLSEKDLSAARIKYSTLHLSSAVELLLKQRLLNQDWRLIFANKEKADKAALRSGDFKSVDFDESLNRIAQTCGLEFPHHRPVLKKLRDLRNKIEHYQMSVFEDEAVSLSVKTWTFVLGFVSEHLDLSRSQKALETIEFIREYIVKYEEFIYHRTEEIQPLVEETRQNQITILDCPFCLQDALPLTGDDTRCLFCKRPFSSDQLKDEWLTLHEGGHYTDPKEMMADPLLHQCPQCKLEGLYYTPDDDMTPPSPGWICFECGGYWEPDEIGNCARCESPFFSGPEEDMFCSKCWSRELED